jgi:membrane-associated phospholipid phosphatase
VDPLGDVSLRLIAWLQEALPGLADFFRTISLLGEFELYLLAIPLVYWCIHKRTGSELAMLMIFSGLCNAMLKHLVRDPRPHWIRPSLGLAEEPNYGLISGHTQAATVFYLLLAYRLRSRWAWALALVAIALMSLARFYLGVHDLLDVIGGVLIGVIILAAYAFWRRFGYESYRNRILGQPLLPAVLIPLAFAGLYVAGLLLAGPAEAPPSWGAFVASAEAEGIRDVSASVAAMLGLGIGFVFEASRVRFLTDGALWKRALRYGMGLAVTVLIWRGLDLIFPDEPLWFAVPFRVVRYLLAGLWISYYAPWAFVKLRLAGRLDLPEMQLTLD